MLQYKLYSLDFEGRIVGPALELANCTNDEAAIAAADGDRVKDHASIEVWQGQRLVLRRSRNEAIAHK